MVNVRKRGKGYQYYFEIAPVNRQKKTTSKIRIQNLKL